jgi:hypothetical protein
VAHHVVHHAPSQVGGIAAAVLPMQLIYQGVEQAVAVGRHRLAAQAQRRELLGHAPAAPSLRQRK